MPPTPTLTPLPPTVTPTPTRESFLPTANPITPTPAEPTPTNTLVPTTTPRPPRTPTPTVEIKLPTRKPTITPTANPTDAVDDLYTGVIGNVGLDVTAGNGVLSNDIAATTVTLIPPTPIHRQYSIAFDAEENVIVKGECTDLEWRVSGAESIWLDGRTVGPSGREEVCPTRDTIYQLTIQLPGSAELLSKTEEIMVEDE